MKPRCPRLVNLFLAEPSKVEVVFYQKRANPSVTPISSLNPYFCEVLCWTFLGVIMAVPFAFPEENNDVDVIIRQLSLLLNRLAVEFKKQRNENLQLRAKNKLQSGSGRQTPRVSQDSTSGAVTDTVLNAIASCKRFAVPHRVAEASTVGREFEDAKNDSMARFDKIEFADTTDNQDLTEVDPVYVVDGPVSFFRLRWESCRMWWSWFVPRTLTTNQFWTTTVICVVGWHLLR